MKIKTWWTVILFLVLNDLNLFGVSSYPIYHGDRSVPKVSLTFDDGPHPNYTYRILKILSDNHVKATFFIVGQSAKNFPDVVNAIVKEGHELANHTFTHTRLDTLDKSEIRLEIQSMKALLQQFVSTHEGYFRPPGGRYNRLVLDVLQEEGIPMVLWDVNAGDYHMSLPKSQHSHYPYAKNTFQKPAAVLVSNIVRNTQNGSIILLHNTDGETLKAIPHLIKMLRQRGFLFVPLNQLLKG